MEDMRTTFLSSDRKTLIPSFAIKFCLSLKLTFSRFMSRMVSSTRRASSFVFLLRVCYAIIPCKRHTSFSTWAIRSRYTFIFSSASLVV